jgi:hypothetical protein
MSTAMDGASTRKADAALALLASLAVLAVNAVAGFPGLSNAGGDNDSLLQLVQVRDLLADQGWFDMHQYRMGLEGGFVMHWSRLLDAPLAAMILAASALTGNAALAESITLVLWPALLFCLTMLFMLRASRRFAGESAVLPTLVVGAAALYFIGIFSPGSVDHHNLQLMLTVASLSLLLDATLNRAAALIAGSCAALTLAIGMESAPYAAVLGATTALLFAAGGSAERPVARDFGLGFAGTSALVFIATVPVSAWGAAQCDTFSVVQFAVAVLAGTGLAAIASVRAAHRTSLRRLISLGLLALVLGCVVITFFPQCLASPYANLDPRLRTLWLDEVDEAQSLFKLAIYDPPRVAARYVTPLLAMGIMLSRFRRYGWRRQDILVGGLLAVSFAVSIWEVRASTFSITFAVIPLAAWIARWRREAAASPSSNVVLRMAMAWLVSVNAVWAGAAQAASRVFQTSAAVADGRGADPRCEGKASFLLLGRQPATTVLAVSNLGSPILAYTGHRVFAGPYHRNIDGNLLALDAFLGSEAAARSAVGTHHVGLVALCRGNSESGMLAAMAPGGFLDGLMRGSVPAWLEPVAPTQGGALELFRVRPEG